MGAKGKGKPREIRVLWFKNETKEETTSHVDPLHIQSHRCIERGHYLCTYRYYIICKIQMERWTEKNYVWAQIRHFQVFIHIGALSKRYISGWLWYMFLKHDSIYLNYEKRQEKSGDTENKERKLGCCKHDLVKESGEINMSWKINTLLALPSRSFKQNRSNLENRSRQCSSHDELHTACKLWLWTRVGIDDSWQ